MEVVAPENPIATHLGQGVVQIFIPSPIPLNFRRYEVECALDLAGPYQKFSNRFFYGPDGYVYGFPVGVTAYLRVRTELWDFQYSDWTQVKHATTLKPKTTMLVTAPVGSKIEEGSLFTSGKIDERLLGFTNDAEILFLAPPGLPGIPIADIGFDEPDDRLASDLIWPVSLGIPFAPGLIAPAPAIPGAEITTIGFDEPDDRLASSLTWPVSVSVPFANGALHNPDPVLQLRRGDTIIPSQAKNLLNWPETEYIQWALLDFQVKMDEPLAVTLFDTDPILPNPAIEVTQDGSFIYVDTGVTTFKVSKTAFRGVQDLVVIGQAGIILTDMSHYWTDQDSLQFPLETYTTPTVTVETEGPLKVVIKAEGYFRSATPTNSGRAIIRIAAFAGLPYIRMHHTFVWTENNWDMNSYLVNTSTGVCTLGRFTALGNCYGGEVNNGLITGWVNGQPVKFTSNTNTSTLPNGLVYGTTYYVRVLSTTTFTIHPTATDAINNTNKITPTTIGTGIQSVSATTPRIKDLAVKFNTGFTATQTRAEIDDVIQTGDATTYFAQLAYNTAYIDQVVTPDGIKLNGWAETRDATHGLTVACKDLWQQPTKQFTGAANSLTMHLWASAGSELSWRLEDRNAAIFSPLTQTATIEFQCNNACSPKGVAKTHEIWFWPTVPATQNVQINDLIQNPPVGASETVYACNTEVIPRLRAASETPEEYQYIEDNLLKQVEYQTRPDPTYKDYDIFNFGEVRLNRSGAWRLWDNHGHNSFYSMWCQFLRTGSRRYFEIANRCTKHYMDVDICHEGPATVSPYNKFKGGSTFYSPGHWSWGPLNDNFHFHPAPVRLCYSMTGYEWARDVAAEISTTAGAYLRNPDVTVYGLGTVSREQYGQIQGHIDKYRFTGLSAVLDSAYGWFEVVEYAQSVSNCINAIGDKQVPKNNFWGFFFSAMNDLYHSLTNETRRTAIRNVILKLASDYAATHTDFSDPAFHAELTGPSSEDGASRRLIRSNGLLTPFTFAYWETGNFNFLQMPLHLLIEEMKYIQETGAAEFIGYSPRGEIERSNFMLEAPFLMSAWQQAGFPVETWAGNLPIYGSRATALEGTFISQLTCYINRTSTSAGAVKFMFAETGGALYATGEMKLRITKPDLSVSEVTINTFSSPNWLMIDGYTYSIANGQPTGEWRFDLLTKELFFHVTVKSDQAKLVVYTGGPKFHWHTQFGSAKIYFQPEIGATTIAAKSTNTNNDFQQRPTFIYDNADQRILSMLYTGSNTTDSVGGVNENEIYSARRTKAADSSTTTIINGTEFTSAIRPYMSSQESQYFVPTPNPYLMRWWLRAGTPAWQDVAKTTTVTADTNPVAFQSDLTEFHYDPQNAQVSSPDQRPLYRTGIINSLPALQFDGTDDHLYFGGTNPIVSGAKGVILISFRPTSVTSDRAIVGATQSTGPNNYSGFYTSGNRLGYTVAIGGGGSNCLCPVGSVAINTNYVALLSANGTTWVIRLNGVTQTLTNSGVNIGKWFPDMLVWNNLSIGALRYNNTIVWNYAGYIAEVRILNGLSYQDDQARVLEHEADMLDRYI